MTREELTSAWMAVCASSEEGDFTVTRKKGEWKVQITTYMDAALAHQIVSFMAKTGNKDSTDWHPDMFTE